MITFWSSKETPQLTSTFASVPLPFALCTRFLINSAALNDSTFGTPRAAFPETNSVASAKPVTRMKRLGLEPARRKRFRKPLQRRRTNRFGAVESHFPATQIELRALLFTHLAHAKVVSEIRSAARRRSRNR